MSNRFFVFFVVSALFSAFVSQSSTDARIFSQETQKNGGFESLKSKNSTSTTQSDPIAPQLPPKPQFLIVVLAGQSNMAGRGFVEPEDKTPNPRVLMLNRDGAWVPAVDPVHFDKRGAGVGPGRTFANLLAASDPTITVGLVPTACGGSSVDDWAPGVYFSQTKSHPFDDAISRTQRALEDGTLAAILWLQGESDCSATKAAAHEEKLFALFETFRREFDAPDVPILVGELSRTIGERSPEIFETISNAQRAVVARSQPAAFVSSEGATLNPDGIHFDRASQIEFGQRFYAEFEKLVESSSAP